jgi:signal transduction histidine kinase
MIVQSGVYYFSRLKKKYSSVIAIYAVCSYMALILNFYSTGGTTGSAICFFYVSLNFLIAFSKPKQHILWVTLHILTVWALLLAEYLHPEWISPDYFKDRSSRFVDLAWSYTLAFGFIFVVTTFLRRYFTYERRSSEKRAEEISAQNKQIIAQYELLEKVNQEKNKLFSIVSHDLRTPIDGITSYLELLSQNLFTNDEKAEIETALLEQTKYTSELLLNLLSWAKAQMEGITAHLAPTDLNAVVEQVTNNKVPFATKKGIRLSHLADLEMNVICDKEMLQIVLRNIMNNALKFTRPGGEVLIRTYKKGPLAEIEIRDCGIGIPIEKHADIFTMRSRSTYGTDNEKGIGLGLIMCKQFMEYQQGSIRFESEYGKGTTFYLSLPLTTT